jgi:hypothetical protein
MADFLEDKRREIGARLKELKPLAEEYERLLAAAAALDGVTNSSPSPPATTAASPAAARKAAKRARRGTAAPASRRGRPKGTGKRATEALAIVAANPGIEMPALAEQMGIKKNYLYRVMPSLAETGQVRKEGRGWHAVAGTK